MAVEACAGAVGRRVDAFAAVVAAVAAAVAAAVTAAAAFLGAAALNQCCALAIPAGPHTINQ